MMALAFETTCSICHHPHQQKGVEKAVHAQQRFFVRV